LVIARVNLIKQLRRKEKVLFFKSNYKTKFPCLSIKMKKKGNRIMLSQRESKLMIFFERKWSITAKYLSLVHK
jgi:hypothetical protein